MKKTQEIIEKEMEELKKRKDIYLYDIDKYGENSYNTSMINEISACERMLEKLLKKIIKLRVKEVKNEK